MTDTFPCLPTITPTELTVTNTTPHDVTPFNPEAQKDFEQARDALKQVTDVGLSAIKSVQELADQSQAPDYYDSLNGLLKSTADAAKTLIGIHKTKKDIIGAVPPSSKNTNQTLVFTSAKMLDLIKGEDNDE